ncbi:MAG: hypothetical protein ABIR33_00765 [Pyrinomonadaceae bacterium]
MAIFAQNAPANLRLERNLIMLAAVIANDLKSGWSGFTRGSFL